MRRVALVAVVLLAVAAGSAVAHDSHPYGPAPASLTWAQPPDLLRTIPPGGSVTLPRGLSDVDAWVGDYRLRQRLTRDGWRFTRGARTVVGYVRVNRDVFNLGQRTIRVYGWWAR